MTDQRMALLAAISIRPPARPRRTSSRAALRWAIEELMEADVDRAAGGRTPRAGARAARISQRSPARACSTPGRARSSSAIPKLARGSYFQHWLREPRQRAERALLAVSRRRTSRASATRSRRSRPGDGRSRYLFERGHSARRRARRGSRRPSASGASTVPVPYLWLDAQYEKVREGGRIVNTAFSSRSPSTSAATARSSAATVAAWPSPRRPGPAFLRYLQARGLTGVRAGRPQRPPGLRAAVASTLDGAAWQRCRVHLLRDLLIHVPRHASAMVAAFVRTIFAQPDEASARAQLRQVAERLATSLPQGRRDPARRRGRRPRVSRLPARALDEDLVHEPARAAQPRARPAQRRGRHLPQPRALLRLGTARSSSSSTTSG